MSARIERTSGWTRFDCPIEGCGHMVSGNLGQEPDDAIDHIEEHWVEDLSDDQREQLVADASALGFDPVGPTTTCFCGGAHITGSCLAGDQEVQTQRSTDA